MGGLVADREHAGPRVAKVVVLVPEDGQLATEGDTVAEAVGLVLGDLEVPGWTIDLARHADEGRSAAQEIAADRDVIAVVGGLSADAVRPAQPVLDGARILFISPADVAPEHTRGPDPAHPQRPYETYYRVAAAGVEPAAYAAVYAVVGLGATSVAVIHDEELAEVAAFGRHARRLGADVVSGEPGDVAASVAAAQDAEVSAIYVAGQPEFAAAVARAARRTRLDVDVLGGAALRSDEFVRLAGSAATGVVSLTPGTLAPTAGLPAPRLNSAGQFGAAALDAATALAEALGRCLPPVRDSAASAARRGCVSELGGVSFEGLTGPVSFDAFGERPGALPQAYVVDSGEWRPVSSL